MRKALLALLGLSVLVDLALGAWAGVDWGSFVNEWLPALGSLTRIQANEVRLLGLVLGLCLLCYAAIQILAILWIRAEREEGLTLALVFGGYLIVSSVITFLAFQSRFEFLVVDGLRGALITVFAVFLRNQPSTIRVLRLPDGRNRASRELSRSAGRRERPRRQRSPATSPERDDRRRDRVVAQKSAERTGRDGEGRSTRTRRGRVSSRDEQVSRPEAESGRKHLRPIVTAKTSKPEARPAAVKTAAVETQVRRGSSGSRKPETVADQDPATRIANRSRTTEELLAEDVARYRRRPATSGDNPLAVVVRGDLDAPRTPPMSSSLVRTGSGQEASERESSDDEASGVSRKRRRRRRRPRSQGSEAVESSPDAENGGFALSSEAPPISDKGIGDRATDIEGEGPAITEALDVLSMLEPEDDEPDYDEPAFGRGRRPDRRRAGRRRS